jgi:hypothetical protein
MAVDPSDRTRLHDEIERCRHLFETTGDFEVLSYALNCCHHADTCPEWIVIAVHNIMNADIAEGVGVVGRWFKQHQRDLIDLARADFIEGARAHGFTWEEACEFAAEYFTTTPAGHAGSHAMMKSYQRVRERGGEKRSLVTPGLFGPFHPSDEHAEPIRQKYLARVKAAGRFVEHPAPCRLCGHPLPPVERKWPFAEREARFVPYGI